MVNLMHHYVKKCLTRLSLNRRFRWVRFAVAFFLIQLPLYGQRVLVEWNFPDETADAVADGGIQANTNRMISAEGGVGEATFTASGENSKSARAIGWQDGRDEKYWLVYFSSREYNQLLISSVQRSSATGPAFFNLQYSLDNENWLDVTNGTLVCADDWTAGRLSSLPLPPDCDDLDQVFVRWLMSDNAAVNGSPVGSTGANRIDDIVVTGTRLSVPAPTVLGATEISEVGFSANWLPVPDATGYELDVAVTENFATGIPDSNLAVRIDFEGTGETKSGYAVGEVSLSGFLWELNETLIGTLESDWKEDLRSARLRGYGVSSMTMQEDLTNGLGVITFQYRHYGSDAQVDWRVEYSTDGGTNWMQAGHDFIASDTDEVQVFSNAVNRSGNVRVRIKRATESGTTLKRLNIDNLVLEAFDSGDFASGYQAMPVEGVQAVVGGLSRGTYFFRVRAVDGNVVSPPSSVVRVRISDIPPGFLFFAR